MNHSIQFIYFDIGGVMMHWHGREVIAKKFNKDLEEVNKIFQKYDDLVCRGKMKPQEMWEKYCDELSIEKCKDIDFVDFWSDTFEAIPQTHNLIYTLVDKYPMGIITDIYPGVFTQQIKKGCVPNVGYTAVIESCKLGYRKPEKPIFEQAQKLAGVNPETILFIDDDDYKLEGAKYLGWHTIKFDSKDPEKSVNIIRKYLGLAS